MRSHFEEASERFVISGDKRRVCSSERGGKPVAGGVFFFHVICDIFLL